jgi:hypothetical protein
LKKSGIKRCFILPSYTNDNRIGFISQDVEESEYEDKILNFFLNENKIEMKKRPMIPVDI